MATEKTTLAIVADLHTNGTTALCPPVVALDDGGSYRASPIQLDLWRCWGEYSKQVKRRATGGKLYAIFDGDIFEGDHHDTSQIITRNPAVMLRLAFETIEPLLNISDASFVVRGTEVHVGKSGNLEEALAHDIGAVQCPDTHTSSWRTLNMEVGGKLINVAHHANMGQLPWTRPNAANALAARVMMERVRQGRRIPNLVARGHRHFFADSHEAFPTRAIFCGAWQLGTDHSSTVNPDAVSDIGGWIVTIENDKLDAQAIQFTPKESTVWQAQTAVAEERDPEATRGHPTEPEVWLEIENSAEEN